MENLHLDLSILYRKYYDHTASHILSKLRPKQLTRPHVDLIEIFYIHYGDIQ